MALSLAPVACSVRNCTKTMAHFRFLKRRVRNHPLLKFLKQYRVIVQYLIIIWSLMNENWWHQCYWLELVISHPTGHPRILQCYTVLSNIVLRFTSENETSRKLSLWTILRFYFFFIHHGNVFRTTRLHFTVYILNLINIMF